MVNVSLKPHFYDRWVGPGETAGFGSGAISQAASLFPLRIGKFANLTPSLFQKALVLEFGRIKADRVRIDYNYPRYDHFNRDSFFQ